MKTSVATFAALLCVASSTCQAETLLEAIQMAYETNPDLRAQQTDLKATDEGYVQARAAYGPQISVSGGYQYEYASVQQPPSLFSPETTDQYSVATGSADLSLVQPLYTAGRNKTRMAAALAGIQAGRQDLRAAEATLLLNVITAYMDVLRDRETVHELQSENDELTAFQQEIGTRSQLGEMGKTDVAQANSRLLAARTQLVEAQGKLGVSGSEYLAAVGQNPGELQPPPELVGMPSDVDAAFDTANQHNADLMAAIEKERAAREQVNEAKAENGPTVSLRVDASIQPDAAYIPDQYDRGVTAQVVVNQPIYTSGLNRSKIREAVDRDSEAQVRIESARRDVVRRVSQAWDQFVTSRKALTLVTEQLDAEEAAATGVRLEERAGIRSTLDRLNADAELTNARIAAIQVRHDEFLASATLLAAMGMLEVKYIEPGTRQYDPEKSFKAVKGRAAPDLVDGVGLLLDQIGAPSTPPPKVSTGTAGGLRPSAGEHPAAESEPTPLQYRTVEPEANITAPTSPPSAVSAAAISPVSSTPAPPPADSIQQLLDGSGGNVADGAPHTANQ